jgi:hypothetical protein
MSDQKVKCECPVRCKYCGACLCCDAGADEKDGKIEELERELSAARDLLDRCCDSPLKVEKLTAELAAAREEIAEYEADAKERSELTDLVRDDAREALRTALGTEMWNRLWGPELEALGGVVYEVWRQAAEQRRINAELTRDKSRLDWLEGEMAREKKQIKEGTLGTAPASLFRRNVPITRESIDESMR